MKKKKAVKSYIEKLDFKVIVIILLSVLLLISFISSFNKTKEIIVLETELQISKEEALKNINAFEKELILNAELNAKLKYCEK